MSLHITDKNWREIPQNYGILPRFVEYGSPDAIEHGMLPLDDLTILIPWDEMKERINEANDKRQMPIHYLQANDAKAHNQSSTNFCWAYGIAQTIEALRPMENQKYVRLGPASLGWLVSWRNRGNYLSSAIKGAIERGIASAEYVPDGVSNTRSFKDGWEDNALNFKPHEFFDANRSLGAKSMAQQCASMLVNGFPIYEAFNWWSHALSRMGVIWDESCKYNLRWQDWNSHGDGLIEMEGTRGIPDEAYGVRVSTVSEAASLGMAA